MTVAIRRGCLSIPDVTGDVERPEEITIRYFDEHWVEHKETFNGMKRPRNPARIRSYRCESCLPSTLSR